MLYFYNTLTRKKEKFQPFKNKTVNLFVCGPTVYDRPHLGHARTYIVFDFIVKYLRSQGYKINYLQNITDIDDKIIKRAKEENITPKELAKKFEKIYKNDMKKIYVNSVIKYARATDYISEIINQIERLIKKGIAYEIKNDGIYFDISKFKDYGKLSKRTTEQAEDSTSRIDESINKRNKGDFCLWKLSKPDEPFWPSPWGNGRPGWHIEDTAITEKEFGPQYDIHGGAIDLIFPHHEAEISQMESISGKKPMVKYWLHTGFLTINGKKMSKSLGNFITLENINPEFLRLFIFSNHYQKPIDYNETTIKQAKIIQTNIIKFILNCKYSIQKFKNSNHIINNKIKKIIDNAKSKFYKALNDNFNTPKALAQIFILINKLDFYKKDINSKNLKYCLKFLTEINKIFQIFPEIKTNKEIKKLINQLEKYRKEKKYEKSDKLREQLKQKINQQLKLKDYDFIIQNNPDNTTTIKPIAR